MNEIKPSMQTQVANLRLEQPTIKLVMAQIYQAQLQQLTSGAFSLQLPTKHGSLQIPLPTTLTLMPQPSTETKSLGTNIPVQVEFLKQQQGQLELSIQSAVSKINLPISLAQSQQIILALSPSMLQQLTPAKDSQMGNVLVNAAAQPTAAIINASISITANKLILNIANLAPITLSSASSQAIGAALQRQSATYGEQPIHIIIRPTSSQLQLLPAQTHQANVNANSSNRATIIPPLSSHYSNTKPSVAGTQTNSPPSSNARPNVSAALHSSINVSTNPALTIKIDLSPAEHQVIQHQLRQVINQQAPSISLNNQQLSFGKIQLLKLTPQANTATLSNNNYQVQIQQRGNQWLLQLTTTPISELVTVASDKLNHTIQLLPTTQPASASKVTPSIIPSRDSQQQSVQQAWRQLLPLVAPTIDSLAEQSTLEPAVNKILQIIRQGQPDGNKVLSVNQLTQQLTSLLQFQPLQTSPNLQTGAGTLALAIQLLLGNLQQKATTPTNQTPQAQRLAAIIGQLDPMQSSGLLRRLATHSSAIQQSQLNMVDSSSNQQLVLQLPLQQGEQSVLNQITIEQREAGNKDEANKQKQWRLTMKFDLQQLGRLLVVATLQQNELQLQFYTEQAAAQRVTEQFLPLLTQRCQAQGLDVNKAECVLGLIPDSLMPRTNSLVTIRV